MFEELLSNLGDGSFDILRFRPWKAAPAPYKPTPVQF
jgi:hypothetical protein